MENYKKKYSEFFNKINELNKYNLEKNKFINIFFLLKPHPFFLRKYKILDKTIYFLLSKIFINLILLAKDFIKNVIKFDNKVKSKKNKNKFDYIIFSHLVSNVKLMQNDFYFNEFIKYLKKRKKNYLIVYFQHYKRINKNFFSKKQNFFFFKQNLNFFEELSCLLYTIKLFFFYATYPSINFKHRLVILSELLDRQTSFNIKTYYQCKKLFKKISYDNVICTFEGFNFEKIVFEISKYYNKKVVNIGYQHAPIFNTYYNIFQAPKNDFLPDKILTTGKYYTKLFKKKIKKKIKIYEFGSNKINILNKITKKNKKNICLVTPEAIESECIKMFQFCIDYTRKYDDLIFLWRTHPLINIKYIVNKMNVNIENNKNIKFSTNKDLDFIKSKYCLFRGSTTVIKAIENNCYPLYLEFNKEEPNINIFDKLKEIKTIKNIHQLNLIVANKNKLSKNLKMISSKKNNYFKKVNLEKFKF